VLRESPIQGGVVGNKGLWSRLPDDSTRPGVAAERNPVGENSRYEVMPHVA